MKVILFDPMVGGHHIEYASYIIRHLVEQGDDVAFVTWRRNSLLEPLLANETPVTVEYVVKDSTANFGGNTLRRFRQGARGIRYCFDLAAERQVDIIHHLYLERSELPLYLHMRGAQHRPWKLFGTLFWPYFIHEPQEKVGLPKHLYHAINRWALGQLLKQKKLAGLFVHTDRIKKELVGLYADDSLRERIVVVPDPVEPPEKMSQEVARERLGLPQGEALLLYFGNVREDKGPDILLKACQLARGSFRIVVAGELVGIAEEDFKKWKAGLENPTQLIDRTGYIPQEEVSDYFFSADAVVLPYRRAFKGTSGVLQRAAAARRPVVAADVGEVGQTVKDHLLGIVVEAESPRALAEGIDLFLLQQEKLSKQVQPNAERYATRNHWRKMAAEVRNAYLTVIDKDSSGERSDV